MVRATKRYKSTSNRCLDLDIYTALFTFENSPFPCIIAIFLNKILFEIRTFSIFFFFFFEYFNWSGIGSHFYKDAYDMFHRYTSFHQTISPDDAILKRDNLWDRQIMSHCVDTGFDDILYKCNRGLVLPVKGNSQPLPQLFFWHFRYLIFWYFL